MKKQELEEFRLEVNRLYDEYLMKTEKRGVSYGELVYIQELKEKELNNMYNELLDELGDDE